MRSEGPTSGTKRELEAPPAPQRPKHLRAELPTDAPELVPARMLNELLYCERLMYLEWAQGEFADNHFTVEGRLVHRRADKAGRPLAAPAKSETEPEERPYSAKAVWLSSTALGLTAKIDVVDIDGGRAVPIEYKRGRAPNLPEGAWLPERAQIAAQVMLLREHGFDTPHGEIYFAKTRRRVVIEVDSWLRGAVRQGVARARALTSAGVLPDPLVDDARCGGCSLVGICLPDEVNLLRGLEGKEPFLDEVEENFGGYSEAEDEDLFGKMEADPWGLSDPGAPPRELRRLHPSRDERVPLYVQAQGGKVSVRAERLIVLTKGSKVEARLPNTSQVNVLGNVQVSTQAMRALLTRNIPLTFFSHGGYYLGRLVAHDSKNVELRVAQHRFAADVPRCLSVARGLVAAKVLNTRTLLRRNGAATATQLRELKRLAASARVASSIESLLGTEGAAARLYFSAFQTMLKGPAVQQGTFDFTSRNRRPPKDPINALLSLAYALLAKELALVCASVGLDPLLGVYHQPRYGRPALALDLMEEFRPLLADSVVVGVVNNGMVTERDFVVSHVGVALEASGRAKFISAYERRMNQLVTHPVFGYRLSYRRVLEVQARLFGRHVLGEIEAYPEFRTR